LRIIEDGDSVEMVMERLSINRSRYNIDKSRVEYLHLLF
jgi:hypothetical protein